MAVEALNSLGEALRRSGYETKAEKLRRLMAQAIGKQGEPGAGLSAPSLARFETLLLNENDVELVWELFAATRTDVMRKLFDEVLPDVRAGKDFGGHHCDETHEDRAPEGEAAAEAGVAVQSNEDLSQSSAVVPIAAAKPPANREHHRPPGDGINGMAVVMRWERQSWLRRFTVGNKAVANLTYAELERAIADRGRDYRWLMLLRDSWPPYEQGGTVIDHITEEDGDRLYEKAKEMANA